MTDLLLVHGSFHSARCWDLLVPELEVLGVTARAIDLPGHGTSTRRPWTVSMATYRDAVVEAATATGGGVAVLAHSMGGQVVSAAAQARPDLFSALVYLSAFVPGPSGSHVMAMPPVSEDMRRMIRPRLRSLVRGVVTVDEDAARTIFYNGCDPSVQEVALAGLCAQPIRPLALSRVPVTAAGLGSASKHYVQCLADNALPLASQRAMIAQADFTSVTTLDSDHSPFYAMPAELARVIADLL